MKKEVFVDWKRCIAKPLWIEERAHVTLKELLSEEGYPCRLKKLLNEKILNEEGKHLRLKELLHEGGPLQIGRTALSS